MKGSATTSVRRLRDTGPVLFLSILLSAFPLLARTGRGENGIRSVRSVAPNSLTTTLIDANNLTCWISDGPLWPAMVGPYEFNVGFPEGTNAGIVDQEGIVFGGMIHDGSAPALRVGGTAYASGMEPGTILQDSSGKVTGAEFADRIWRVRPNYKTADLTNDAAAYFLEPASEVSISQIDSVRSWYARDWNDWPAAEGAPYVDVNHDGRYEPDIDIPGVANATQTVWAVGNDLGNASFQLFNDPPIGIEEQVTEWTWAEPGYPELDNMMFKQVKLIYKGTPTTAQGAYIDSLYIAQWSDVNDGYNVDDYAGCDTGQSLGYVYNGKAYDSVYSPLGLVPPAGGYEMVSGPAYYTGSITDSAVVNLQWRRGYKYYFTRPMTHFVVFWDGETLLSDPEWGTQDGAAQMYNLMRFDLPYPNGYPSSVPISSYFPAPYSESTNYILPGDPTTHSGWVDGILSGPGTRRIICTCGPIRMALGDTAELVIATIAADSSNYIGNVSDLKWCGQWAQYVFNNLSSEITAVKTTPALPEHFALLQNYPNPFNPSTAISYKLSTVCYVTLKVYDVLGREVVTLVDGRQNPGTHTAIFDGSKFASGVYFYRLSAFGGSIVRRMVLVK